MNHEIRWNQTFPMPQLPSSRSRSHTLQFLIGANTERCIYCEGTRITREGKRYKKLETVQLWYCHDCDRVFTPQVVQGKRTPLKVILEGFVAIFI
jgi:transposase-like protein